MSIEFVTVAKLRAELAGLLARLDNDAPIYVTQRGQARAVLLDVDRYRELMAQLEYLDDSLEAALARERRRAGEPTQPLEEVVRELSGRARKKPGPRVRGRVSR